MDRRTARVYERDAERWIGARRPHPRAIRRVAKIANTVGSGARVADLGSGPGWYAAALARRGLEPVGVDVSAAMLAELRRRTPGVDAVRGDLAALPFARGSLDGAVGFNAYQHLTVSALPVALAHLHDALRVGAPLELTMADLANIKASPSEARRGFAEQRWMGGPFPGRLFSSVSRDRMRRLIEGAGFTGVRIDGDRDRRRFWMFIHAVRADTLPDYVRPRLDLLVCGLNPSILAAETGVPYGRPGNRFWPAAVRAGLSDRERDPWRALEHGIGFTDLVKRPTRGARELTTREYATGLERLEDCVRFFRPRAVCFVGLDGWRRTVDRSAAAGRIPSGFGGRPAYLMPSTSGLNAHGDLASFVRHLRAAKLLGKPQ